MTPLEIGRIGVRATCPGAQVFGVMRLAKRKVLSFFAISSMGIKLTISKFS